MSRTIEYGILIVLVLCLVMFIVEPMVHATVSAMNNSANLIAEVSHGQG